LCYADDIILISHSVTVMQKMVDLCDKFSVDLDVRFNTMKSVAMRTGPRFDVCVDLILSGGIIQYVQSLKYLGVCVRVILQKRYFLCPKAPVLTGNSGNEWTCVYVSLEYNLNDCKCLKSTYTSLHKFCRSHITIKCYWCNVSPTQVTICTWVYFLFEKILC